MIFIVHLAGANRPKVDLDFHKVNYEFTKKIVQTIVKSKSTARIFYPSSITVSLNNKYGESKRKFEELLFELKEKNKK